MKKFLLFAAAAMTSIFTMAGNGSTKANAIDFDWDNGHVQEGSKTLWYKVSLDPLYQEENPSLTLHMVSQTLQDTVQVTLQATVAGQSEERTYTIMPGKTQSWSANASTLVRMKQTEVYITLKTVATDEAARIKLSAKVYDAVDLDEACKDAKTFNWTSGITQNKGVLQWFKVNLKDAKKADKKDVKITMTNKGTGKLNLRVGQSLDCPSSGLTKRSFVLEAGEKVYDTIPQSMIKAVAADELYVTFDNNQPIEVKAELIDQPASPIFDFSTVTVDSLPVVYNEVLNGKHYFKINVRQMNDSAKYEPEFTFRNNGENPVKIVRKMSFENPVWGWQTSEIELAAGEEAVEVIKKNVVDGINVDSIPYIYLVIDADAEFQLIGRYKHVREGKACKSNIDFNWEKGHTQEGKTTQWYAIDVTEAKRDIRDIKVKVENIGYDNAKVSAAMAFSCPYIDLQEMTRTIKLGDSIKTTVAYSMYAMMSDTIWVGVTTDQDIRISVDTAKVETKPANPDDPCLKAIDFDWEDGGKVSKLDTVWYKIDMREVRDRKEFPTVYVKNLNLTSAVTVYGELSLECPDTIPNQTRSLKLAAGETYSKQLARNMFENIKADSVYLRVVATDSIAFEIRLTEEVEGSSCTSPIRFNWTSGNDQAANVSVWYAVDLREAKASTSDVKISIINKGTTAGKGTAYLAYSCLDESLQSVNFSLGTSASDNKKTTTLPHSALETVNDSIIFVRVYGDIALHLEATLVPAEELPVEDQVSCETIATATELQWNTIYTQNGGSQWYILKREVLDTLLNGDITAEAHIWNEAGVELAITGEIAYHCPITTKMMSKRLTVKSGEEFIKMIAANTAQQVSGKDTVLIRLKAAGKFRFEAHLVSPWNGNTRDAALRLKLDNEIEQEANTIMWYRINTADLKAVDNLDGLRVFVEAKTLATNATIEAAVFEGDSQEDMIEYFTGRTLKRTSGAIRAKQHYIPGYVIKGLADKVLYVRVKTTQPIKLKTVTDLYPTLATPIPTKEQAILAVPNVDYQIPAGGQWFAVCLPTILDNYKMTRDAGFEVINPNSTDVTVTSTATWQEELTYNVPKRSRKIGANKHYVKTFYSAIEAAAKRAGFSLSLESTDPSLIDSLVHSYVTDEHMAAYVFIDHNGTEPLIARVKAQPKTGEYMSKPILFDWEHGNVNAGATTANAAYSPKNWFLAEIDSTRIPEGKELELHVTNWGSDVSKATAKIMLDTLSAQGQTVSYDLAANEDKSKRIARELLIGNSNVLIEFESDSANYIWAEIVDARPKDTIEVDTVVVWCAGEEYDDPFTGLKYTIDAETLAPVTWDDQWEWVNDTAAAIWDSLVHFTLVPYIDPVIYTVEEIADQPVIKAGQPIDVTAATTWLMTQYAGQVALNDTIKDAVQIIWEISTNNANTQFEEVSAAAIESASVVLRYRIVTFCEDDTLTSPLFFNPVRDTITVEEACNFYDEWQYKDTIYYAATLDSVEAILPNGCKAIHFLDLKQVNNPAVIDLRGVAKYGNRLLLIDRFDFAAKGFATDSLYAEGGNVTVEWYRVNADGGKLIGEGYSYNKEDGDTLVGTFFAIIKISSATGCGLLGRTQDIVCEAAVATPAPALVPNMVMPGENVKVINLDPNKETVIRIFTTEGLLQSTYNVRGQETFMLPAAADHGFYLVELLNDSMKSTLRYIVK